MFRFLPFSPLRPSLSVFLTQISLEIVFDAEVWRLLLLLVFLAIGTVVCRECHGNGYVPCSYCHASGIYDDHICYSCNGLKQRKCYDCDGSGNVTCSKCDGYRVVTAYVEVCVVLFLFDCVVDSRFFYRRSLCGYQQSVPSRRWITQVHFRCHLYVYISLVADDL